MFITAMVAAVSLAVASVPPVYEGHGWKVGAGGVTSLNPEQQFTVTFESQAVKDRQAKYLTKALPQINASGVRLVVGGLQTVAAGKCPALGTVHFTEVKDPLGVPGYSRALPCRNGDNSAWGGIVQMNPSYDNGEWYLPTYMRWNVTVHELLHAIGLGHPNVDLDKDGVVEDGECVKTSYGNKPIMCSPNGGYKTTTNRGRLVHFDTTGLKNLVANYAKAG